MRVVTAWLLAILSGVLWGAVPDYYRLLSHHALGENSDSSERGIRFRAASDGTCLEGLQVGVASLEKTPGDLRASVFAGCRQVRLLLSPGEFRSVWLPIQSADAGVLSVSCGGLRGSSGQYLSSETVCFQRGVYSGKYPGEGRSCFLIADAPWPLRTQEAVWILVTFHAPIGTRGGVYSGKIDVALGQSKAEVPVEVSVLSESIGFPDIVLGAFVPGHYSGKTVGHYTCYAPSWQRPENMLKWVRFWHSRGMNSPFLYHLYMDLTLSEGKVVIGCRFLDDLMSCMQEVGMKGPLLIDMRHLSWWCHAVALDLQKRGLGLEKASSEVRGEEGLSLAQSGGKAYPVLAGEVFRQAIRAFDRKYGHGKIPLLYLSEEEIGYHLINGYVNKKTLGYETFNPILMNEVGRDKVCLVDNSQGYGFPGVDRGARDDVKYRSYNNWTQEALDACQGNGREVWLYNVGWNRHVASYLMRLNARAYHQWADGWCHPGFGFWLVDAVNDDGVLSTVELERTMEGMRDLGYFRLLDRYMEKARIRGLKEEERRLQKLRHEWFGVLPVKAPDYAKCSKNRTDEQLDQLRWQCVRAVESTRRLLGETPLCPSVENRETTHLPVVADGVAIQHDRQLRANDGCQLVAYETTTKMSIDGRRKEESWALAAFALPFRWTANHEAQMRARASSQEEFERMGLPSASSAQVTYDQYGLYFWAGGNHVDPSQSSHADDDAGIWSDDVFEFFWQESEDKPEWHVIVNAKGHRTLFRNGIPVKIPEVKSAAFAPLNGTGGAGHEVMVPWTAMGRQGAPVPGTQWRFNVCRNFNSWQQLSSWAQVQQDFGLGRGVLVFSGAGVTGDVKVEIEPKHLGLGRNQLLLKAELTGKCHVTVTDSQGQTVCRQTVSFREGRGNFPVVIAEDRPRGGWWLAIEQDGQRRATVPLWFGVKRKVVLSGYPKKLGKGFPLRFQGIFGQGNGEPSEQRVWLTSTGIRKDVEVKIRPVFGENEIVIQTGKLPLGIWTVRCGDASFEVELQPGPWMH